MRSLRLARVEDLGAGDLVKFDCTACRRGVWLTRAVLLGFGIEPSAKVLDLRTRIPCSDCGAQGRAVVWVRWAKLE